MEMIGYIIGYVWFFGFFIGCIVGWYAKSREVAEHEEKVL